MYNHEQKDNSALSHLNTLADDSNDECASVGVALCTNIKIRKLKCTNRLVGDGLPKSRLTNGAGDGPGVRSLFASNNGVDKRFRVLRIEAAVSLASNRVIARTN